MPEQTRAIDAARSLLVDKVDQAELRLHELRQAVESAEWELNEALVRLRSFDAAFAPPTAVPRSQSQRAAERQQERSYRNGKTAILWHAIRTFRCEPFTPGALKARIHEVAPNADFMFPDLPSVSRILNKLIHSKRFQVERLERGAGRKTPTYRQRRKTENQPQPLTNT